MFVILGPTSLQVNGDDIHLGPARQRALLAVLLYHAGESVPKGAILEHLWPGQASRRRGGLHELVSRVRAVLRAAGQRDALVRSGTGYRLDVSTDLVDYHRFCDLVGKARQLLPDDPPAAVAVAEEALRLWRDEPLAELRSAEAELMRDRMQERHIEVHRIRADALIGAGRPGRAVDDLARIIQRHPYDVELAHRMVLALAAAGRADDAMRFARSFIGTYESEVGMPPYIDLIASVKREQEIAARRVNGALDTKFGLTPPASPTTGPPPRQIHPRAARLVGRASALASLDEIVSSTMVPTILLTGMPGVGKTTLAAHWAHLHAEQFPDGQLYLDAQGHGPGPGVTPVDALGRFLTALGLAPALIPADTALRRDRYNQLLQGRKVLIILDNVRDDDQVAPLLTNSTTCLTIVISRNRLRGLRVLGGTRHLHLEPLTPDESVDLLTHHVHHTPHHDQPDSLRALANLSGGLPLALSIVGAYVSDRPGIDLTNLARDLAAELLDHDGDDGRATTLRTVFGWSYQALEPTAARLFRLLGLFPGAKFSEGAAAALLAAPARDALNALIRASLIRTEAPSHHSLHDLLRRYTVDLAATTLTPDERRAALHRLFDWYLHTAAATAAILAPGENPVPDMAPPRIPPQTFDTGPAALAWIDAERANLTTVVHAAAASGFHRYAWQIAGNVHRTLSRSGRQDDVLDLLRTAVDAAVADRHDLGHVGTTNNLAATYFATHDYRRAAAGFAEALRIARDKGLTEVEGATLHNLGAAHLNAGDAARAITLLRQSLDITEQARFLAGQAATLLRLGNAHQALHQYDAAVTCYTDALRRAEQGRDQRGRGRIQVRLAELHLTLDDPALALTHCAAALAIHQQTRDDTAHCDALLTAADAHRRLDRHHDAQRTATRALQLSDTIGDLHRRARALAVLADSLAATGDRAGARARCEEALTITADLTDPQARTVHQRLHATAAALTRPPR
ncbi:tetratricopeptide repeat protein [Solwaraspora sp. WMMD937]|uniref:AfsR/SARP family transcriptional regulator n=1 Tax=Solwaraspora sp. WMMD937 TaxID=3016090 RepID=UPI00249B8A39|nr:BTAD domain-containing putative transcriptional regulator [Solwaraspora sp. WMMD937]WFE20515.1 tetratricopeptide repeat protein [Solwaraspora sp. WMMD937]